MMHKWFQYMSFYYTKIPLRLSGHRLLYVVSAFALMLLFIPWNNALKQQMQTFTELQATIHYLKNNIQSKKHQRSLTSSQFLSYVEHQLQAPEFKKFTYKIQQTGPKSLEVTVEQVPYATLMSWLWSLSQAQRVIFKQIDLSKTSTPGMVQARMVMLFDS